MFAWLLLSSALWLTPSVSAMQNQPEKFYAFFLAYEGVPYRPLKTHTTLTVARWKEGQVSEYATMSWLPEDGKISLIKSWPCRGKNRTLAESIAFASENQLCMFLIGPYEVNQAFAESFRQHLRRFETDKIGYQIHSSALRGIRSYDCAHAIESWYSPRQSRTSPWEYGRSITQRLANDLHKNWIGPDWVYPEVAEKLGIHVPNR